MGLKLKNKEGKYVGVQFADTDSHLGNDIVLVEDVKDAMKFPNDTLANRMKETLSKRFGKLEIA